MDKDKMIKVEVAYAKKDEQVILAIDLRLGATLEMAIQHSGILNLFPEIDLTKQKIGIFGQQKQLSDIAKEEGDRIEIYRPLLIDPKEARRLREATASE